MHKLNITLQDKLDPDIEESTFRFLLVMNGINFKKLSKEYRNKVYEIATKNYYLFGRARLTKCNRYTWGILLLLAMNELAVKENLQCLSMTLLYTVQQTIFHEDKSINKRNRINLKIKNWAIHSFKGNYLRVDNERYFHETNDLREAMGYL